MDQLEGKTDTYYVAPENIKDASSSVNNDFKYKTEDILKNVYDYSPLLDKEIIGKIYAAYPSWLAGTVRNGLLNYYSSYLTGSAFFLAGCCLLVLLYRLPYIVERMRSKKRESDDNEEEAS